MPVEPTSVLVPGPWTHRDVSTNGTRLHIAECGSGPLVLLVHGFPEFWWSWRHQLTALADAGFHAVACDLRGYGASDKPPRGYDIFTLASDLAGLIRALGERQAVVVGQDCGGFLAWATAVLHPDVVRRLVVVGAPHPLRMRQAIFGEFSSQLRASSYLLGFQLPWRPERELVRDDAALVGDLMRRWAGPGFPDPQTEARARKAMQIPGVAHSSMEYYRWVFRSMFRPDGWRMLRDMHELVTAPTLQLHGLVDSCVLPATAKGSGEYVAAPYTWRTIPGAGHFPHEEAPDAFNAELLSWLE
ncbi:MAG TPA: alpha/beta hydrolase [Frankiaceae bacterium]|jgi:pimeloyl-ACP methyl ester carboxylesterase|nr:alpha/beta hydrolase [Frankiaceae bacterium]